MPQKTKAVVICKGITPVGEIKFCHLDVPDMRFFAEGRYSVTLLLNPEDPKVKEWTKAIEEAAAGKKLVFKHDEETNYLAIKFHTQKKPKVVLADTTPLADGVEVGWHSTARVAYALASYTGFGGGCTWYLNAIQIIKLVERGGMDFDKVDVDNPKDTGESDDTPF